MTEEKKDVVEVAKRMQTQFKIEKRVGDLEKLNDSQKRYSSTEMIQKIRKIVEEEVGK